MNDVISLDSVRRGRHKHPAGGAGWGAASTAASASGIDDETEPALSEEERAVADDERLARVSDTVVRALGRRQLSVLETQELLVAQGATAEEAEVLVARYEELGYLDDMALAETLVERLSERNHKSRGVIARELSARKIPGALVSAALDQLDEGHEFDLALEAATKRIGQLSSYDDATAERRLVGFLTRRGFASAVVREVTRRAMATRKSASGPRFR